ncbi:MAG: Rod shape-determining protein MreC [Patescibacteria group bacterium]|nr:Rod shape-determining protein MreC [Patescibacteria group bacterium]
MTHYRFDNQEKKRSVSRTKWITGVLFVVAAVVLIVFIVAPAIQNFSRGPAWARNTLVQSTSDAVTLLTPKKVLIAKINTLEAQIQSDQASLVAMQDLESQNTALRTELSYVSHPSDVIAAQVLDISSQSLYNNLVIDRGSNDGVRVGQLVTAQGTVGLGTVASVSAKTATVMLFSGPQFSGDVLMKSENITVPATGQGGGTFEIHIPQSITVSKGELIAFPNSPDISIGVVQSIMFDPRNPFQTVLARTPVNLQELRFVEVVK